MPRIQDVIARLLPEGSNPWTKSVKHAPEWPPDLFAIVASLIEQSGCYADPIFTAAWDSNYFFGQKYRDEVVELGREWASTAKLPSKVQSYWKRLLALRAVEISNPGPERTRWTKYAMTLLAISDEASMGIGFITDDVSDSDYVNFPFLLMEQHFALVEHQWRKTKRRLLLELPYIPHSLCKMVPYHLACVQPKTRTPLVGCTIRSLSHHLALLPSSSTINTSWLFAQAATKTMEDSASEETAPLNILLVPLPYVIHGDQFVAADRPIEDDCYFSVAPRWLPRGRPAMQARQLQQFLTNLAHKASREVGDIHAIVFPEAALSDHCAEELATIIGRKIRTLELFITGTVSLDPARPTNTAFTCRLHRGQVVKAWHQSKHHRWRLDEKQVEQYHLGHALNPKKIWWERIDVRERQCAFSVVRQGASLAVLVCEDLARFDPVLPAINAIGPNLVVALLLDGPQMNKRWPSRYATVLADDPGSSVLTLTSLGMVKRSAMPGSTEARQVALWKQPGGEVRELVLPPRDHALAITVTSHRVKQWTMDGRSCQEETRQLNLSAVRGIRLVDPPAWIELD